MEFDFQYLIYKYTLAGAREKFEEICTELMHRLYGAQVHNIRVSQGDGGIDVMQGDFSGAIVVYQCKFFHESIGDAQKEQIRESFRRAWENKAFTMSRWILCLPIDLSVKEMSWWSNWRKERQEETGIPIELYEGQNLLNLLRENGLYHRAFGSAQEEVQGLLTKWIVDSAKAACTPKDIRDYHMVDHRFETMLRVIASDQDVPHTQALQAVGQAIREGHHVILGGNSGMGKTSLMLRFAVEWVRGGNVALWLPLADRTDLNEEQAERLYRGLLETLRPGQQALICIDDPYEAQDALACLRRRFPEDPRLRLLLAERSNRLTQMAAPNANQFHGWFSDAVVVTLDGLYAGTPLRIGACTNVVCPENRNRREQILKRCLQELEKKGTIPRGSSYDILREVLQKYGKPNVTLVELIYRAMFHARMITAKAEDIVLDWDEWKRFIKKHLGKNVKASRLYGVIAACSVFDVPMTLKLFGRIFNLEEQELREALRSWRGTGNVEPVLYRERARTIRPKHGVIAELFFLFNNVTPGEAMEEVLKSMNELEIGEFLKQVMAAGKWALQSGRRGRFDRIDYYELLNLILDREEPGVFCLSDESRAMALLGLVWCIPKGDRSGRAGEILALLEETAPPMMEGLTFAMLYTEWGKLLADHRKNKAAEEKLQAVIDCDPKDIHSRTELGRLLAKQRGREAEAEQYLKEAIRIDPKNLHPHTELGRLLSKQRGREAEAEQYLKEAIQIDPKHIQSRTELGRLLSKQRGREAEAEQYLKEAIRINDKDIQSRTELGRLLSKQRGREAEAERYLKEAMKIDPKHIQSRTELGRLLSKQRGREVEAEQYLKEILGIDRQNIQARTELGRLLSKQRGREAEAERYFREILSLDRKDCHARVVLAELIQKDRPQDAEQLYREVLQIDRGNQFAQKGLREMGLTP